MNIADPVLSFFSRNDSATRIVLIYVVVGGVWVLSSDQLLAWLVSDPAWRASLQTLKGWGFVLVTAMLLLVLIRHHMRRLETANHALQQITVGASADIGEDFFRSLARLLVEVTQQEYALVSLYDADSKEVRPVVAVGLDLTTAAPSYPTATPLDQRVLEEGELIVSRRVREAFPDNAWLQQLAIESYAGHSLLGAEGRSVGLLCVFSTKPIRDPQSTGALLRIVASRAATELRRHQAEQRRKAAESRFRHVIEAAAEAILAVDERMRLVLVNAGAEAMLGYQRSELFFRELDYLLPHDVAGDLLERFRATLANASGGSEGTLTFNVRRKSGELLPVEASLSRADTEDGAILTLVLRDIARRLELDRQQREQFRQISTIFDSVKAVVAVTGLDDNKILFLNRQGLTVFGEDAVGRTCCEALLGDGSCRCNICMSERLTQAGRPGEPVEYEFQHPRNSRWYRCIERAVDWVDGRMVRLLVMFDIQDRREMEQMKGRMLASLSHEMRTPLTALLGYTELMLVRETDADQRRQYLTMMREEAERLDRLINNFVTLQRLTVAPEAQKQGIIQLAPLLRNVINLSSGQSSRHPLRLECPEPLPPVLGMAEQLQELLHQLVINAIRFSPQGGEVVVGAVATSDEVTLSVQDRGIGIAPEEHQRIFEQFYRSNAPTGTNGSGVGLGLALARKIVEQHHGRIWVESSPGEGSTFYIALPVATTGDTTGSPVS